MGIPTVAGLDHVVVVVRSLDAAAAAWSRLGFTISPRGLHSAHMGTANHTLMLENDYLELMGVVAPTERNAPMRELLLKREGLERAAFTTTDATSGVAALRERGFKNAIGPTDFSRPVVRADGTRTEARFATFQWPLDERPGGLRLFACQHFTRDAVWLPELQAHANTAMAIHYVGVLSTDPMAAAQHMGRLIDEPLTQDPDGAPRVATGPGRGAFVFLDHTRLLARFADVSLTDLPKEGAVVLALRVRDLAACKAALGGAVAAMSANRLMVAPGMANGVLLVFAE
jgi:glyoxalase-like protein